MSKVNTKHIKLDTSATGLNSRAIPANFTPTNYTPTQVGSEGTDKISAHLNGINTALASSGSEGNFSGSQSQENANVTGLSFSTSTVRAFEVLISVSIAATSSLFQVFKLIGVYNGSSWYMTYSTTGNNTGVDFSISDAGQVLYSSGSYAGFSSMTMKFKSTTLSQ